MSLADHLQATRTAWADVDRRLHWACGLCKHSVVICGARCCDLPVAHHNGEPQPVAIARDAKGVCGPNAVLMHHRFED